MCYQWASAIPNLFWVELYSHLTLTDTFKDLCFCCPLAWPMLPICGLVFLIPSGPIQDRKHSEVIPRCAALYVNGPHPLSHCSYQKQNPNFTSFGKANQKPINVPVSLFSVAQSSTSMASSTKTQCSNDQLRSRHKFKCMKRLARYCR